VSRPDILTEKMIVLVVSDCVGKCKDFSF